MSKNTICNIHLTQHTMQPHKNTVCEAAPIKRTMCHVELVSENTMYEATPIGTTKRQSGTTKRQSGTTKRQSAIHDCIISHSEIATMQWRR